MNINPKACRVIVVCFKDGRSPRNNSPTTSEQVLKCVQICIQKELELKTNMPYDIILINHDVGYQPGNSFLNSINGKIKNNKKIILVNTPNYGISFDGYFTAFDLFKEKYDYWIFSEDDHTFVADNYYEILLKEYKNNKDSFLAFAPISKNNSHPIHSGGGFGLTSVTNLLKISEKRNGFLSCMRAGVPKKMCEVHFTNDFIKNNLKIIENKTYCLHPVNIEKCLDHQKNLIPETLNKPFLFKVGL